MLFLGLSLLGYVSYQNLSLELFPNVQLPTLIVQVGSPMETDPEYIEQEVVIPLEGAVSTLEGIEEIESTVTQRYGTIMIYYSQNTDFKYAYLKLQEKINEVRKTLPEDYMIQVVKVDLEQMMNQFMELQVRGGGGVDRIRDFTTQEIQPRLENIDGIAGLEVYGGRDKSIEVTLNEAACEGLGISMNQVRNALSSYSGDKVFAGRVYQGDKAYFVNIDAEYTEVTDIGDIIIDQDGPVMLKDIAEIFYGVKEQTNISRVNGMESVSIILANDNQANLIDLSARTQEVIEELNDTYRESDIEIIVQNNTAEVMEENLNQIIHLALIGGLLAIVILWIFLRNIRLVSVIAVSIPVSVYTAFNFFYAYNVSINSLTLVGMALAIGMLIDNSVVVLENIYRLVSKGMNILDAVVQGTREVSRAIIAATLTTVTIFIPFIFAENFLIRMIGKQIGVSIISTLLVSLLVALLFIPMASNWILGGSGRSRKILFRNFSLHHPLIQKYVLIVKTCMRNPATTIVGTLVVFFAAMLIALGLSLNLPTEVSTPTYQLTVEMPQGTTLERADAIVAELEEILQKLPEKEDIVSRLDEEDASISVSLVEDYEKIRGRSLKEIRGVLEEMTEDYSTAEVSLNDASGGGGGGGGGRGGMGGGSFDPTSQFMSLLGVGSQEENVIIKGEDFGTMKTVAEDMEYYLDELSIVNSVRLNISDNRPEVHLMFDPDYMGRQNISLANVASDLNNFRSQVSSGINFKQGAEEYEILLKYDTYDEEDEQTIEELRQLPIHGASGNITDLEEISQIIFSSGLGNITRSNQEKQIVLSYRFTDEITDSKSLLKTARMDIDELVSGITIPAGVAIEVVHEDDQLKDFKILIAIAFILIFMILAAVFESFSIPVVLLLSIPLAALGSLIALIFTGNSLLNANTLTGFLILLGVVVNNGIILIDYSRILQKRGYRRTRALMVAGLSRIRPILITAITTIVALFPLAMGKAEYVSVIGAAFAITVIGGLMLSTLLTLVFIPTFRNGLQGGINWMGSLSWKNLSLQIVIFTGMSFLVIYRIDRLIWELILLFGLLVLIPGTAWFVMNSLRRASSRLIPETEPIHISIRKLVKIYDRDGRFVREWKSGKRLRDRLGEGKNYSRLKDLDNYLWQVPLLGFLVYFVYFYIDKNFWVFLLGFLTWGGFLLAWQPLNSFLEQRQQQRGRKTAGRLRVLIRRFLLWIVPLINLVVFQLKWESIALVIIIGVVWFLLISIYTTGNYLNRENPDIQRLKGPFKKLRKFFFRIVLAIPVLGRKRKPFRAVDGVSLEIGTGMFGLLGPNGAGKTTLMRIVCGILDQSYGKIWINGHDTQEKREELQGLIGYLPQEFGTYENMSAFDYLNYQAILKGVTDKSTRRERVDYVLSAVHLSERKYDKIGSFSGGMKQRIGIAQILLHLPRILVVDEPTAGLDPRERIRFRNLLVELSRDRIVIFSTHIIEDISSSCNQVAVMKEGRLRYVGEPVAMTKEAQNVVWQFYLDNDEFRKAQKELRIVHHMAEGKRIKVRCISGEKPHPEAIQVQPNLEDAYLWLLRNPNEEVPNEK